MGTIQETADKALQETVDKLPEEKRRNAKRLGELVIRTAQRQELNADEIAEVARLQGVVDEDAHKAIGAAVKPLAESTTLTDVNQDDTEEQKAKKEKSQAAWLDALQKGDLLGFIKELLAMFYSGGNEKSSDVATAVRKPWTLETAENAGGIPLEEAVRDGLVSDEDMAAKFRKAEKYLAERVDTNKDGVLSLEERNVHKDATLKGEKNQEYIEMMRILGIKASEEDVKKLIGMMQTALAKAGPNASPEEQQAALSKELQRANEKGQLEGIGTPLDPAYRDRFYYYGLADRQGNRDKTTTSREILALNNTLDEQGRRELREALGPQTWELVESGQFSARRIIRGGQEVANGTAVHPKAGIGDQQSDPSQGIV